MLGLDPKLIEQARSSAQRIVAAVQPFIASHTTVSIERATLRLFGVEGALDGIPYVNIFTSKIGGELSGKIGGELSQIGGEQGRKIGGELSQGGELGGLAVGVTPWFVGTMLHYGLTAQECAEAVAKGEVTPTLANPELTRQVAADLAEQAWAKIAANRAKRDELMTQRPSPWLYVIVATGNIYEDLVQAQNAARQGADIIAVIRSTAQSLLDYVPEGPTTEGFGGTFATQANFRLMRKALDEVGEELGRYIRLTNYCSGLCMPEIAALGALERLDMMLNDSMYGILFRDINMKRTLVDQHFSRMINAKAGIIINTGEDNYLTTDDAYEAADTVLASQFINEQFAKLSGLPDEQLGLGHAFEMDPDLENGLLYELADALLSRACFPNAPLKYMPPTRYKTGDIFKGHLQDALFNLVSVATGQQIHLVGMLTEALHTPLMHDRYLSIENARYIMNNARALSDEIQWRPGGLVQQRAQAVLAATVSKLGQIETMGLMASLGQGVFANTRRQPDGGKGGEGLVGRGPSYYNPFFDD